MPPACCRATASRGVLVLPGLGNNNSDYAELAQTLESLGVAVETAAISRLDWCGTTLPSDSCASFLVGNT